MAGFSTTAAYIDALNAGQQRTFTFRKTPSVATVQGVWFDLSLSPGVPVQQYYASAPLEAATLTGRPGVGFPVGADVGSDYKRFIHELLITSPTVTGLPASFLLCDYLLYYPFVDQGTSDVQPMVNTVPLSRYTDGEGVMIVAVQIFSQALGGATFQIGYTNSQGVSGRMSQVMTCTSNSYTSTGIVITSRPSSTAGSIGPFIGLQAGDTGVRSIESFQMLSATDLGILALVLVKPIVDFTLREITAPMEVCFPRDRGVLPEFKDGAYLNLLTVPNGSMSGIPLTGYLTTCWG